MILDHTLPKRSTLKARKTFTLSPESVEFLEALRKARKAHSISSVLDDILRAVRREQTKAKVNQAVGEYYNSLSSTEAEDQMFWAEFALHEFPKDTD